MQESANTFLAWLGEELERVVALSVDDGIRFSAAHNLVQTAIARLDSLPNDEQARALHGLRAYPPSGTGRIGGYRIPFDDRDRSDWIEGIVATLDGYLDR